jgi:integrase
MSRRRIRQAATSPGEVQDLTEQFDDRFKPLISTAAYLELRWSELVALRTEDVVLPARRMRVTHTLVEVNGRFHEGPPKTAKGLRSMTIPGFLADAIGEHIGRFPSRDGHIFSAAEGGAIRKTFVRREFKPAAKAANLLPLRVHDLRHTAAGLMIALGAHPKVIQERLGHSSIKVTLDTYGHLFPNLDEALAHGLDELARTSAASTPPADEVVVSLATG